MCAAGIPSLGKAWLNVSISRERYTTDALDLDAAVCSAHTHAANRNRPSVFAVDQQTIHLDFRVRKTELASAGHALSDATDDSAFLWCSSNLCPAAGCFFVQNNRHQIRRRRAYHFLVTETREINHREKLEKLVAYAESSQTA